MKYSAAITAVKSTAWILGQWDIHSTRSPVSIEANRPIAVNLWCRQIFWSDVLPRKKQVTVCFVWPNLHYWWPFVLCTSTTHCYLTYRAAHLSILLGLKCLETDVFPCRVHRFVSPDDAVSCQATCFFLPGIYWCARFTLLESTMRCTLSQQHRVNFSWL